MEPVRRYRCARILAVLPHETEMADPVGRFYRLTGREMAE
jgi:hypothetical protein